MERGVVTQKLTKTSFFKRRSAKCSAAPHSAMMAFRLHHSHQTCCWLVTCSKSALDQWYVMPDLFTMGHWYGDIPSNVTIAYSTKWCIDVAVLSGRPLTHDRNLSMKNQSPFIAIFLSFFFMKLAETLHEGKKVRWISSRHIWSVNCKKTDSLGA